MKQQYKALAIVLILLLLATGAMAFKASRVSSNQTASAAITTTGGYFHSILFSAVSAYDVTVDVYDNATTNSGRKLMPTATIKTTSTSRERAFSFDPPVEYFDGIYVNITTSDTLNYMVFFNTEKD